MTKRACPTDNVSDISVLVDTPYESVDLVCTSRGHGISFLDLNADVIGCVFAWLDPVARAMVRMTCSQLNTLMCPSPSARQRSARSIYYPPYPTTAFASGPDSWLNRMAIETRGRILYAQPWRVYAYHGDVVPDWDRVPNPIVPPHIAVARLFVALAQYDMCHGTDACITLFERTIENGWVDTETLLQVMRYASPAHRRDYIRPNGIPRQMIHEVARSVGFIVTESTRSIRFLTAMTDAPLRTYTYATPLLTLQRAAVVNVAMEMLSLDVIVSQYDDAVLVDSSGIIQSILLRVLRRTRRQRQRTLAALPLGETLPRLGCHTLREHGLHDLMWPNHPRTVLDVIGCLSPYTTHALMVRHTRFSDYEWDTLERHIANYVGTRDSASIMNLLAAALWHGCTRILLNADIYEHVFIKVLCGSRGLADARQRLGSLPEDRLSDREGDCLASAARLDAQRIAPLMDMCHALCGPADTNT